MIRAWVVPALLALCLAPTVATQAQVTAPASAPAPDLDWLHGEWEGTATLFGRPASVSITAGPALLGGATTLTYRAQAAAADGSPEFRFEGRGTYRIDADGRIAGQWSDSQGHFHPLAGRVEGTTMTIDWGEPRTEMGRSTYRHSEDGSLTVTDAVLGKEGLRPFATASYTKVR